MCVQLHGDAAFTGQGVVMEGLGLSRFWSDGEPLTHALGVFRQPSTLHKRGKHPYRRRVRDISLIIRTRKLTNPLSNDSNK